MPTLADSVREHLPEEIFGLVAPLLKERPKPISGLRNRVRAYGNALERAHKSRNWPDMDIELGRACAKACNELLDHIGAEPADDAHRLAHVAVRYFVTSEDDEDDLESLVGFDDDALVINACAKVAGASKAVIPLMPR